VWLLVMVCITEGWVIYQKISELVTSEVLDSTDAALREQTMPLPAQPDFTMPAKGSLAVILKRPVFSQTRRPSADAGDGASTTPIEFTFSGVVISGGDRTALVVPGNGGIAQQLTVGEDIAGWTLVEIAPDRIVIRRDTVEAEVFLDYAAPAPPGLRTESRKEAPAAEQVPADQAPSPQGDPEAGAEN